jgi:hypothetical protein
MKNGLLFLTVLSPLLTWATHENQQLGARSFAMGKASVAIIDNWSVSNNHAALALFSHNTASVYYENRFTNTDLGTKSFNLSLKNKYGGFGLSYSQFGFDLFKETKIGISYARALSKNFWAGVKIAQIRKKQNVEHGSQSKYIFEIGLLSEIISGLYLGFHLFNPTQEKFSTWQQVDKIPTIGRLGLMWKLSDSTILTSEIQKDLDGDLQIKGGFEYSINEKLFLRAGVHNHPNSISMGIGVNFNVLKTNLAFAKHPVLGYTPTADICFKF